MTLILGAIISPWSFISSSKGSLATWLSGYNALLGPKGGALVPHLFLVRQCTLNIDACSAKGSVLLALSLSLSLSLCLSPPSLLIVTLALRNISAAAR